MNHCYDKTNLYSDDLELWNSYRAGKNDIMELINQDANHRARLACEFKAAIQETRFIKDLFDPP